jgi:hypothetical protein
VDQPGGIPVQIEFAQNACASFHAGMVSRFKRGYKRVFYARDGYNYF